MTKDLHVGVVVSGTEQKNGKYLPAQFIRRINYQIARCNMIPEEEAETVLSEQVIISENSYGRELLFESQEERFFNCADGEKIILHFYDIFCASKINALIALDDSLEAMSISLNERQLKDANEAVVIANIESIAAFNVVIKDGNDPVLCKTEPEEVKKRKKNPNNNLTPFAVRYTGIKSSSDQTIVYYVKFINNMFAWRTLRLTSEKFKGFFRLPDGRQYLPLEQIPKEERPDIVASLLRGRPQVSEKLKMLYFPNENMWEEYKKEFTLLQQDVIISLVSLQEFKEEKKQTAELLPELYSTLPTRLVNPETDISDKEKESANTLIDKARKKNSTPMLCVNFIIENATENRLFANLPNKYKIIAREIKEKIKAIEKNTDIEPLDLCAVHAKIIGETEIGLVGDERQGGELRPYLIAYKAFIMEEYMRSLWPLINAISINESRLPAICVILIPLITAWTEWLSQYHITDQPNSNNYNLYFGEAGLLKQLLYYISENLGNHNNASLTNDVCEIITSDRTALPFGYSCLTNRLLNILVKQIQQDLKTNMLNIDAANKYVEASAPMFDEKESAPPEYTPNPESQPEPPAYEAKCAAENVSIVQAMGAGITKFPKSCGNPPSAAPHDNKSTFSYS